MVDKEQQIMRSIGKAISKYRQAVGLTQAELAEILGIGNHAISRMERGTTVPTVLRLIELSDIFRCDIADLVTDVSNRSIDQARALDKLLSQFNDAERAELVAILEKMIAWKLENKQHNKLNTKI